MASQRDLISRLYSHSHRALRRYVRRLVASCDTADEVVQEAFLRTYQNAGRIDTPRGRGDRFVRDFLRLDPPG